jgi:hypothetical protein
MQAMNHQIILAQYSVKNILRLSSQHMKYLQLYRLAVAVLQLHAMCKSANLTDGETAVDLQGMYIIRCMPHSQLHVRYLKRCTIVIGAEMRLVR